MHDLKMAQHWHYFLQRKTGCLPLLMDNLCIAGNWWEPVVSVIWRVQMFLLQLITYNFKGTLCKNWILVYKYYKSLLLTPEIKKIRWSSKIKQQNILKKIQKKNIEKQQQAQNILPCRMQRIWIKNKYWCSKNRTRHFSSLILHTCLYVSSMVGM